MKWISVKDKLPLDKYEEVGISGTFIVHFSDYNDPNERSNVSYADYITGIGWCYPDGSKHKYWADKITHWMEFPEAPEEYKEERK